jgi:DNA polymerase-3 subunit alpha
VPKGRDAFDYLVELCEKASSSATAPRRPELDERLRFELKTVREMGFADYFLIVATSSASRSGTASRSARAAARPPARSPPYCLEITDIDPMRYGCCSSAS